MQSQTFVNRFVIHCTFLFLKIQRNPFSDCLNHKKIFNLECAVQDAVTFLRIGAGVPGTINADGSTHLEHARVAHQEFRSKCKVIHVSFIAH